MAEKKIVAYIARHGTTKLNEENKFRGQLDTPLDDQGREDAVETAKFLADKPIGQAWTSDLSRAKDTAKIILKGRGIKATPTEGLRPLDSGKFAGKEKSDKNKQEMQFYHDHETVKIPGGESLENMHDRARKPLFKAFRTGLRTGKPSLVSAHSSIVHTVGELLHGDHKAALVEPGGVVAVYWDGKNFGVEPVFRPKDSGQKEEVYAS